MRTVIAAQIRHLPLCICLLIAMFAVNSARGQSTEVVRDNILEAWRTRQSSVESARFRVHSTLVLTESELRRIEHRQRTLHGKESQRDESSQGDKVLIELYELAFDGEKMRYHMTFDRSTHEDARSVNRNMTLLSVTNGTDSRSLETFPDQGVSSGVIHNSDRVPAFRSAEVEPLIQTFRAFAPYRRQLINNLRLVDGEYEVDGTSVVVVQQHYDGTTSAGVQYWTDPVRDYVILRNLAMTGDSRAASQTDIDYEKHDSGNWVPVKWVRSDFDSDGSLRRTYEFRVTDYEINPKLPTDLFELEFSAGVEVFDKRKGVGPRVNVWTVNSDGSKNLMRGVDPDKRDKSDAPRRNSGVFLWANGLIVGLLVVVGAIRRNRRGG